MKLRKILYEITRDEALKVLGISSQDATDSDKLKQAYRKASFSNHPDRGGSTAAMQDVTAAYELLSKSVGSSNKFDWGQSRKEYLELGLRVLDILKSKFQSQKFLEHFSNIYGQSFKYTISKERPKSTDRDAYYAGFSVEFFNASRDIVFTLDFSCYITDVKYDKSLGSGVGNISYPLGVSAYGFFGNKKLKITQRDYQRTQNHDVLFNPEMTFPESKLNKFKVTSASKQFRRQDMLTYLTSKLGLSWDGDSARLTLPDKITVRFSRSVFMRMPYWSIYVYENNKGIAGMPYVNFPETEATAEFFSELVNALRKKTSRDEVVRYMMSELTSAKNDKNRFK